MTVTSVAGSTSGFTKITVEPTLTSGNSYKYKVAANPTIPVVGALCNTGYKVWNGTEDIEAATGQKIVIAEVNADSMCIGACTVTVTSAT